MEFKLCKELIRVDGEGRVSPRVQVVLSLPIKDMECSLTNLVFLSQASCDNLHDNLLSHPMAPALGPLLTPKLPLHVFSGNFKYPQYP